MRLGLLQPVQQTIAVAVLAEFAMVNATVLFEHVALDRPQEVVRGVVQQFGLAFCAPFARRLHLGNLA